MPHRRPPAASASSAARAAIRFDKWLWAARFYKTRSLAAQAIDAGQARLDGERVKPAHALREGACVTVRRRGIVVEVVVTACSDRRGSASEAARLYRETEASVAGRAHEELARRAAADAAAPRFPGRPTKRDRRKLADFLEDSEEAASGQQSLTAERSNRKSGF